MTKRACFYDLDGTLLDGNVLTHYMFYARTEPTVLGRARRMAGLLARTPLYFVIDQFDRRKFNEMFYTRYKGLSRDRLTVLGTELAERDLLPRLFPAARDIVRRDREAGYLQVLISGALDFVVEPIARDLGIDYICSSRLEFTGGLANGKLAPPVVAGPEKPRWIRAFVKEHDIDLDESRAYADDIADLPMLSLVGRPVAVNPDFKLRTVARAQGWPIVETRPETQRGLLDKLTSRIKVEAGL